MLSVRKMEKPVPFWNVISRMDTDVSEIPSITNCLPPICSSSPKRVFVSMGFCSDTSALSDVGINPAGEGDTAASSPGTEKAEGLLSSAFSFSVMLLSSASPFPPLSSASCSGTVPLQRAVVLVRLLCPVPEYLYRGFDLPPHFSVCFYQVFR